jgi:hypothetical protein
MAKIVTNQVKIEGENNSKCAQKVKSQALTLTPSMQIRGVVNKCSDDHHRSWY